MIFHTLANSILGDIGADYSGPVHELHQDMVDWMINKMRMTVYFYDTPDKDPDLIELRLSQEARDAIGNTCAQVKIIQPDRFNLVDSKWESNPDGEYEDLEVSSGRNDCVVHKLRFKRKRLTASH